MLLSELISKIGFKVDDKELKEAKHHLEGIHKLLETFAAVEIVRGIAEMTEKFGEMAEHIHLAATSAGITTDAFQKLAFAAQQNGVSSEEMSGAMARITKHLYDARNGSAEAQKVFSEAGFTADQIYSFKNGSDVLHVLADKFKGMKDPIKEIGLLMPLAGRASYNMIGLMEKGGDGMRALEQQAEELGVVLGEHQVEALVMANRAMMALGGVIKTLGASIVAEFAPSVRDATKEFLNFYKANKDIIQVEVKKWVYDISFALGFVWGIVKFVAQSFLHFAQANEELVRIAGEVIASLIAISATIFVVKAAFGALMIIMSPTIGLLKLLGGPVLKLLNFALFQLVNSAAAARMGMVLLNLALSYPLATVGVIVAAIAGLVAVLHDAWVLLSGGKIEDTWLGGLGLWVEKILHLGKAVSWVKGLFGGGGEEGSASGQTPGQKSAQGGGFGSMFSGALQNLTGLGGLPTTLPVSSAGAQMAAGGPVSQSNEINAPITINVPAGTDHKMVGDKVKDAISQHLDRVHREAQRSLRPAVSY